MSANLLEGVTPNHGNCPLADGVLTSVVIDSGWYDVGTWPLSLDAVAENQTLHLGASVRWHGEAAKAGTAYMSVKYADAAGHTNDINVALDGIAAEWRRISAEVVLPSGMRIVDFHTSANRLDAAYDLTAPTLSYGGPVTLVSDAHTPYATQDHLAAEYATKAALKVTSDAVTAEVTERGKLAGRVGTLESTTGTHTSKLQQLAASITSLVKGESTYTDPDGKSAASGIYSLVKQTRDSVTALFGSYTKTADLASTEAVRDAKKAGTDAASAASAAQSTADAAKSTADSLSTMVRQYSGGVLVGRVGAGVCALVSADGEFDVVSVSWDGSEPTVTGTVTSYAKGVVKMLGVLKLFVDSATHSTILEASNAVLRGSLSTLVGYSGPASETDVIGGKRVGITSSGPVEVVASNFKPIYRAYNPYDKMYLYTADESEYSSLVSRGWTGDGVAFHAFTS
jgi:hypothetical protein